MWPLPSNIIFTLVAVVGLAVAGWIGVLEVKNMHLHTKLDKANNTITVLTVANQQLKAAIDVQNGSIDELKRQATVRERRAAEAIKAAGKAADVHKARAAALDAHPATGNECQDAQALLNDYLEGLRHEVP